MKENTFFKKFFFPLILITILVMSAVPSISFAQSFAELKDHIANSLQKIEAMHDSSNTSWDRKLHKMRLRDALTIENENLKKYLLDTLPLVPESLTDTISSFFPYGMGVVTSSDKKIRQWSWDTWMGGSCPTIYQVIEYKTAKGIKCIDGDKPSYQDDLHNHWYDTIYSIRSNSGVTYYLPVERWKADGRNSGQNIKAYTIVDTGLVADCKIFQTRKSLVSKIALHDPDMAEYYEIKSHEITIVNNGHRLLVPLIDDKDKFTSKWIRFEFDGEHYIYKRITK